MSRRRVVIHQPDFLPYLGFFDRLLDCDLFILLDHVQFTKGGWHNRDRIKSPEGPRWLTVPVQSPTGLAIAEVRLTADATWPDRHLRQLAEAYRKAPGYAEVRGSLEALYRDLPAGLADFNMRGLVWLMEVFGITVPVVRSSSLRPQGRSNAMLVDLLQKVGATEYLSGVGARAYFDPEVFAKVGVPVLWQDFRHPFHPQLHGAFEPFLSSIDLLMNLGLTEARRVLREGARSPVR
ncbi:MAG: WbqC family protein [Candidatus Sericytochromatia bacterium]|nr:WbqC family protein [Candidatus Sericytochromatia bacterium]